MEGLWSEQERIGVEHSLRLAVVGSPDTARRKLDTFLENTGADELIISTPVHDFKARLRSLDYFAELNSFMKKAA